MYIVYSEEHKLHDPPYEFLDGRLSPYHESPRRAEIIREALIEAGIGTFIEPRSFGLEPLVAVHSPALLAYYESIYDRWVAAGGAPEGVMPSSFAVRWMHQFSPDALSEPGYYCFDLSAVITATTYPAIRASANCALTGAALLLEGQRSAYALCRPPGHHAGRDLYGGYCFLNNVAIAAEYLLRQSGAGRAQRPKAAILDIDFHHGNGTQQIFYERDDVFFVSIHADPERHYPYYLGSVNERGSGSGEGTTLNFPLEKGITNDRYLDVLDQALLPIAEYDPDWLLISAGFDTYEGDPVAQNDFALTTEVYAEIGARIAALGLPTLHVQEGGYAVEQLGLNVVSYLRGFLSGAAS
jgi:acetoin utilization deacetylase AcuC-like enzyme